TAPAAPSGSWTGRSQSRSCSDRSQTSSIRTRRREAAEKAKTHGTRSPAQLPPGGAFPPLVERVADPGAAARPTATQPHSHTATLPHTPSLPNHARSPQEDESRAPAPDHPHLGLVPLP